MFGIVVGGPDHDEGLSPGLQLFVSIPQPWLLHSKVSRLLRMTKLTTLLLSDPRSMLCAHEFPLQQSEWRFQ